ncbi:neprosin family prolyl endopeptidase [Actinoplanes sp. NPDC051633]|uniref:neprosin family prolyl endopeptidase n=1 Tax=Actinoplanes sp. NPDC051633 TaxID=3155670 RepID=UPI00341AFD27
MSTINAAADEIPDAPAVEASAADATPAPVEAGLLTPPPLLPWGEKPSPVKVGQPGATSEELAAAGADIAPVTKNDPPKPEAGYFIKGSHPSKRKARQSRWKANDVIPPATPLLADNPPPKLRGAKFQYAGAFQFAEIDGSYANLVISKPELDFNEAHTLGEIALESPDQKQTVEVGWTVDPGLNKKSLEPHFFVYHWVDNETSCYNGCGWVQYSKTVEPGDILPTGSKRFGIVHSGTAWWISYDSEWIGYFPDGLWGNKYKKAGLAQWFGEVASRNPTPCSEMGTGKPAKDDGAARFGTISLVNGPPLSLSMDASGWDDDKQEALPGTYTHEYLGDRTFRYGGPGTVSDICQKR